MTNLKRAEAAYLRRSLTMAQRRLAAINFSATRDGHNPALAAEADALECQIKSMERELQMLEAA